jgi:hypothetical protein
MAAKKSQFKKSKFSSKGLTLFVLVFAAVGAYLLLHSLAANLPPLSPDINLTDQTWHCTGPININSVSVTIDQNAPKNAQDAIHLDDCSGYIGQIHVIQYQIDGVKISNHAHDLTINGGTIRCYAHAPDAHQDGVQALGGTNITINNLDDRCYTSTNSDFYLNVNVNVPDSHATNVICNNCFFGASTTDPTTGRASGGPSATVFIGKTAVNSGIENSTVCPGHFYTLREDTNAVNVNTTILKYCSSDESFITWPPLSGGSSGGGGSGSSGNTDPPPGGSSGSAAAGADSSLTPSSNGSMSTGGSIQNSGNQDANTLNNPVSAGLFSKTTSLRTKEITETVIIILAILTAATLADKRWGWLRRTKSKLF